MVNSLSSGQGDKVLQGRLRYADSRDESRAAGLAELKRMVSTDVVECELSLPGHGIADTRQDGGKLFDQVWSVPGLFQLLDDAYHDIIVDAICVDFAVCWSTR